MQMSSVTPRPQKSRFVSQVSEVNAQRSIFDLSSDHKTAINSGKIYPIYYRPTYPGDTFNVQASSLVRLVTPIVPIMDNVYVDLHAFFVPYRLIWDNWQDFITGQQDLTVPQVSRPSGGYTVESLFDYFGAPINVNCETIEAFNFRAYNLIWNEFYRAQDLQDELDVPTGDGTDSHSLYNLQRRGKRHDYFTSCLPWTQKGDPVEISLGDTANIINSNGNVLGLSYGIESPNAISRIGEVDGSGSMTGNYTTLFGSSSVGIYGSGSSPADSRIYADLSTAQGIKLNDLRYAVALQTFLEKDARYGSRYIEQVYAHFGVKSSDSRLQRPEYLGGGSHPLNIQPVVQNSSTTEVSPQGNLGAMAYGVGNDLRFVKSFEEHGVVMILASIRADMTYQQGLDRELSRKTRYDFYFPTFAHLGEQAVLNKEISCRGHANDDAVFGYQERYAELRYGRNIITGKMRSAFSGSTHQSLDVWHLAQKFADGSNVMTHPALNADFIEERPPISRVVAVTDEPEFQANFFITNKATRPLPTYSIPNLIPRI